MKRLSFPKEHRVLSSADFRRALSSSERLVGRYLVLDRAPKKPKDDSSRLGLVVTKRYGKSFERNFFKRRMREIFRSNPSLLSLGYDFIVRPRAFALKADFHHIEEEFLLLCRSDADESSSQKKPCKSHSL